MKNLNLLIWLLALPLTVRAADESSSFDLPYMDSNFVAAVTFFSTLKSASNIEVFEGLPHQTWERDSLKSELERKDIIHFDDYPFYESSIPVVDQEIEALKNLISHEQNHLEHHMKLCGSFHPDYAVTWKDQKYGVLVCFSCREWKLFTPAGMMHRDIEKEAYTHVRKILEKWVVNRPSRKVAASN